MGLGDFLSGIASNLWGSSAPASPFGVDLPDLSGYSASPFDPGSLASQLSPSEWDLTSKLLNQGASVGANPAPYGEVYSQLATGPQDNSLASTLGNLAVKAREPAWYESPTVISTGLAGLGGLASSLLGQSQQEKATELANKQAADALAFQREKMALEAQLAREKMAQGGGGGGGGAGDATKYAARLAAASRLGEAYLALAGQKDPQYGIALAQALRGAVRT